MSILDYLLKDSSQDAYLARDPFYNAARGISQVQIAPSSSNVESFLLPFLQQTAAGAMAGYGKSRAKESQYQDVSNILRGMGYQSPASSLQRDLQLAQGMENPIGNLFSNESVFNPMEYGLESAPVGYSPNIGMTDLLLATSQEQAKQEAAAKTQALYDQFELENSLPFQEKIKREERLKAEGKKAGEGGFNSADIKTDIGLKASVEESLDYVDKVIEEAKKANDAGKGALGAVTGMIGLPTAQKQTLDGIGWTMVGQLDKIQGRETNSDVRAGYVKQYGPQWYDTDEEIERKGKAWKEFLKSAAKSTPALESLGVTTSTKPPSVSEPVPNVPPGYKLQRNRMTGETRIVKQ